MIFLHQLIIGKYIFLLQSQPRLQLFTASRRSKTFIYFNNLSLIVSYTKNKLYKIILSSLMLLESCLLQQNCRNYSCEFFLQSGSYQKYCPFIYLQLVCQYSGMVVVIKSFTHRLTLRNDEFHAHSTFHATKLQGTFNGFELVPPPAKTDGVLL